MCRIIFFDYELLVLRDVYMTRLISQWNFVLGLLLQLMQRYIGCILWMRQAVNQ